MQHIFTRFHVLGDKNTAVKKFIEFTVLDFAFCFCEDRSTTYTKKLSQGEGDTTVVRTHWDKNISILFPETSQY